MTPLCRQGWGGSVSLMLLTAKHLLPYWRNDSARIWQNSIADHLDSGIPQHWMLEPWSTQRTFWCYQQSFWEPKGAEGGGSTGLSALLITRVVGFTTSDWKFVSLFCTSASISEEWCTSTSVTGRGLFLDGAFPPTFFGADAADILETSALVGSHNVCHTI